jgi:hypothetical protein
MKIRDGRLVSAAPAVIGSLVKTAGSEERGSVLLIALVLTFIITLLGVGLFDLATVEQRNIVSAEEQTKGFYAAEAGLNQLLVNWAQGRTVNGKSFTDIQATTGAAFSLYTNQSFNSAGWTYSVTGKQSPSNAAWVRLVSTGCPPTSNTSHPCVSVRVDLNQSFIVNPLIPFFSDATMALGGATLVDTFTSAGGGTYAATKCTTQPTGCTGNMWANGTGASGPTTVVDNLGGTTTIYGNLTTAAGEVQVASGVRIYGDLKYDSTDGHTPSGCTGSPFCSDEVKGSVIGQAGISPITVNAQSACNPSGGWSSLATVQSKIIASPAITSTEYNASNGNLNTNKAITLNPGTLCLHDVTVSGAGISIPSTATGPTIWKIDGVTTLNNVAIANNSLQAHNFQILSSYDELASSGINGVWIKGGTNAYVFVYAPRSIVAIPDTAELFGAIISRKLVSAGSANLHFDRALGNPSDLGSGTATTLTWQASSWKRCPNSSTCS